MKQATLIIFVGFMLLGLIPASSQVVTAAQVNGTWKDRTKVIKVWALGKRKLRLEFQGTYEYRSTSGWTANTGYGSGTADIEGIVAKFKPQEADDDCDITMTFKGGTLLVDQKGDCGFGLNVLASGTYRKMSSRKPEFTSR
jgi:hypothetical protein